MKLIGKTVNVFLKSGEVKSGILFDMEEGYVYLQSDPALSIIIPQNNVSYYTSAIAVIKQETNLAEEQIIGTNTLHVYVDEVRVASITLPDNIDLSSYSDKIMYFSAQDQNVKEALRGKVQMAAEYYPGQLFISTNDGGGKQNALAQNVPTTFGMSHSGSPITEFLNPSEMVTRLDTSMKKVKEKSDDKNKM